MAENYSDSDIEEFTGFTQADLGDKNNDFIPDSEADSHLKYFYSTFKWYFQLRGGEW